MQKPMVFETLLAQRNGWVASSQEGRAKGEFVVVDDRSVNGMTNGIALPCGVSVDVIELVDSDQTERRGDSGFVQAALSELTASRYMPT